VNQRLAKAEQELRVQFTRIAQLQAQLDVLVAALRGSPEHLKRCDEQPLAPPCTSQFVNRATRRSGGRC